MSYPDSHLTAALRSAASFQGRVATCTTMAFVRSSNRGALPDPTLHHFVRRGFPVGTSIELSFVQPAVGPALLEQVLVSPDLGDSPIFEHDDTVRVHDRGKSVPDYDHGPAPGEPPQCLLDHRLGLGVDVRGRLIEDED